MQNYNIKTNFYIGSTSTEILTLRYCVKNFFADKTFSILVLVDFKLTFSIKSGIHTPALFGSLFGSFLAGFGCLWALFGHFLGAKAAFGN